MPYNLVIIIGFLASALCLPLYGQQWPADTFQTSTAQPFLPQKLQKHTATVVLFLDPDCPVTQKYGATLRKLYKKWQEEDVAVVAVYPVVDIDSAAVAEFAQAYQFDFTHVLDPKLRLAQHLHARITPEAYILDSLGQVRYRGAIDNWFYELGRYRRVVTKHYVEDALAAYLEGSPLPVTETEAIGCFIGTGMVEEPHHKP
ncbi:MAG: redoxin domain-containing protein [Cyclobacteriaceae bacterium]